MSAPSLSHEFLGEVDALFERIGGLSSAERDALLADERGRRPEVCAYVAALLFPECAGLELNEMTMTDGPAAPPAGPVQFGRYRVTAELGRGGMGIVFKARDDELERDVAVKIMHGGEFATPADVERFLAEGRATAALDHENVVRVIDGGTDRDRPFVVLEYVGGRSLAKRLEGGRTMPASDAARLIEQLARGVHQAHAAGIVHRDIKPGNILLTMAGVPKLSDFGLAKRLDSDGPTRSYAVLGTAEYMAPEQAAGDSKHAGPAADIYALGAVLYRCLSGRPPFEGSVTQIFASLANDDPKSLRDWNIAAPRDLETICRKCLAKEPERRYASAAALADELRHFQAGEPIAARPPRVFERVKLWAKRRPRDAALVGTVAGLLLAVAAVSTVSLVAVRRANRELESQRADAVEARDAESRSRQWTQRRLYVADMVRVSEAWAHSDLDAIRPLLDAHVPAAGDADLRGFEWHYWNRHDRNRPRRFDHRGPPMAMVVSPDGRWFAAGGVAGLNLWDAASGNLIKREIVNVRAMAASPDGQCLVCVGQRHTKNGVVRAVTWWDPRDGQLLAEAPQDVDAEAVVALDQRRAITATVDGLVRCLTREGAIERTWPRFPPAQRALSADGLHVAWVGDAGRVEVFRLDSPAVRCAVVPDRSANGSIAFRHDGRGFSAANTQSSVWIHDMAGVQLGSSDTGGNVRVAAYSRDDSLLATYVEGRSLVLRDGTTGRPVRALPGHTAELGSVAFSPDGRTVYSAHVDGTVLAWNLGSPSELWTVVDNDPSPKRLGGLAFHPDGTRLAVGDNLKRAGTPQVGSLTEWDIVTRTRRRVWQLPLAYPYAVAYSPDGRLLATSGQAGDGESERGLIRVFDATSGATLRDLDGQDQCTFGLAFDPSGTRLASGGFDGGDRATNTALGSACVWDVSTGRLLKTIPNRVNRLTLTQWSSDGRWLATGRSDGHGTVYDASRDFAELEPFAGGRDEALGYGFSSGIAALRPDGRQFAVAGLDGIVRIWDVATRQRLREWSGFRGEIWGLAYSPDGRRLAAAAWDASIRLYDPDEGVELLRLLDECITRRWTHLAFDATGQRLVIGGHGFVRLLDARP